MHRLARVVLSVAVLLAVILPAASAGPRTSAPATAASAGPRTSVLATTASRSRVAVYLTTRDLKRTLARAHDLTFGPQIAGGSDAITVDSHVRYQPLSAGFGVAMTDTSAYLLSSALPSRLRDAVMQRLFSRRGGIGLSFLRVPIGGSDYIVGAPYTYDDQPAGKTDPGLAHFSLGHDYRYVLPMIREALALNPGMSVMANPWTPPAWMKTDDTLVTKTGPLGTLLPQYYKTFADYLAKFVAGYRAAGVPIRYLGVQNEPLTPLLFVAGIPESYLAPQDEGNLIHQFVIPALRRVHVAPTIVAYDDAFQRSEAYVPAVMGIAGADVGGLAYHCYLSDAASMSIEHARYPQEPALETECSSHLSNIEPAQMAIRSLRNWAQGVQLWNVALDQHLGPKIGNGCAGIPGTGPNAGKDCIAPVVVNTATHRYSLTSDYWALAQFSRFIQLGAQRIDSSTPSTCIDTPAPPPPCGVEDVAFRNPDGSEVLVVTSNDGRPHALNVTVDGRSFAYALADGAIATFVWPAPTPSVSRLRVSRSAIRFDLSEDATVSLLFERPRSHGRRAYRAKLVRNGLQGTNSLAFTGRIGRTSLNPGAYRLTATATDAAGNRSKPARSTFKIAPG